MASITSYRLRPLAILAALVLFAALLMAALTYTANHSGSGSQANGQLFAGGGKTVKGNPKRH